MYSQCDLWNIPWPLSTNQIIHLLLCRDDPVLVYFLCNWERCKLHLKSNLKKKRKRVESIENQMLLRLKLTPPGKKQQCFLSICLPKVICKSDRRILHVSMISHSHASGWFLRTDSLQRKKNGFLFYFCLVFCCCCFLPSWHFVFNSLETMLQLCLKAIKCWI